jgi:hypothetical protein
MTRDLVECLAQIGMRPIMASVATASFKLVIERAFLLAGYFSLFNAGIPQKSRNSLLFSAVVSSPCISMRGFLPLLNGLLDAANLLKYVQHVRIYFCA